MKDETNDWKITFQLKFNTEKGEMIKQGTKFIKSSQGAETEDEAIESLKDYKLPLLVDDSDNLTLSQKVSENYELIIKKIEFVGKIETPDYKTYYGADYNSTDLPTENDKIDWIIKNKGDGWL
tara:strand:- start:51 stop:419 length:369 start_codon:yes stop_codon:yes gene_type:complete